MKNEIAASNLTAIYWISKIHHDKSFFCKIQNTRAQIYNHRVNLYKVKFTPTNQKLNQELSWKLCIAAFPVDLAFNITLCSSIIQQIRTE